MTRIVTLIFSLLLSSAAVAQVFPDPTSTTVNDFAGIIDDEVEARIVEKLETLASDNDVELSVVTLSSVQFYANDMDIGAYATQLFNTWGIGDEESNDGALLLVFRDDRELRVELGSAYGTDWNRITAQVIDSDILPEFRNGNYGAGIESGVTGLIDKVVLPFKAGESAPSDAAAPAGDGKGGIGIGAILGGIVAVIAGLIGFNKFRQSREPCESCGKTGLTRETVVLKEATKTATGAGERRVICPHCGHTKVTPYTIPMITEAKAEKPSHGGGKSEGGGESGKW